MNTRRNILIVLAVIFSLAALALLFSGAITALLGKNGGDSDGFLPAVEGGTALDCSAYVIKMDVKEEVPGEGHFVWREKSQTRGLSSWLLGKLTDLSYAKIECSNDDASKQVFIGVASQGDVDAYLKDTHYCSGTKSFHGDNSMSSIAWIWTTEDHPGELIPAAPADESFWTASTIGTGTQSLWWELQGDQAVVLMNYDASPGIRMEIRFKDERVSRSAAGTGIYIVVAGAVALAAAAAATYGAVRWRKSPETASRGASSGRTFLDAGPIVATSTRSQDYIATVSEGTGNENMAPQYPSEQWRAVLASRESRVAARLLDALIEVPGFALVYLGVDGTTPLWTLAVGIPIVIGTTLLQYALLSKRGQSIGKMGLHIRIVKVDTGRNGGVVNNVLLRELVNGVLACIPFGGNIYAVVDVLFVIRKDRRCIHDMIAGTHVIEGDYR